MMHNKKFFIQDGLISFLIGFIYMYLVLQRFIFWKIILFAFIFAIINTLFISSRNKK